MDALMREREAFKKRAMALPVVERRPQASSSNQLNQASSSKPSPSLSVNRKIDVSALTQKRKVASSQSHNFSLLTKIINSMQRRHLTGDSEAVEFQDLLDEANLNDVNDKQKGWLLAEALPNNPKVIVTPEGKYAYKPILDIKDRQSFLRLLDRQMQRGLGAITYADVKESLPNAEKIIQALVQNKRIIQIIRPSDKEKLFFINDTDQSCEVDEDIRKIWRSVAMDGLDENKIDDYLRNHGISMLHDPRAKTAPIAQKKESRKRKSNFKKLNTHLDGLLEDYDDKK